MHVTFYTKKNCSLCDEAELMMKLVQEDFPLTWTSVDIESNDELHEKYMLMVPVLKKEDTILFYGTVSYVDVNQLFY